MQKIEMKILYITPVLSHPAIGGPTLRVENSIKALNQISKLYIIACLSRARIGGKKAKEFYSQLSYKFEFEPSAILNNRFPDVKFSIKYLRGVTNLCIRVIRKIIRLFFSDDVNYICKYIGKYNIDVVWFSFGNISYDLMKKLKEKLPKIKMVCDTDSVWSRFILRELSYENDPIRKKEIQNRGEKKESEEKHWVQFMDVTTAVSEIDAEYYRQFTGDEEKIMIFSNVVDIKNYEKQPEPKGFKKPSLYIAGSFFSETCPMMKGTTWFLQNVFPIVKKQIPDIHLYIIGNGSDKMLSGVKDNQITITGMLDSVLPYLTNVDISLVPLFFESGTRFKILEAGAAGIPIVSTTLGAEGIPVTHGKDIMIADDPDSFAECIVKLTDDKSYANELAVNCRKLVQEKYSIENLSKEGNEIINYLVGVK